MLLVADGKREEQKYEQINCTDLAMATLAMSERAIQARSDFSAANYLWATREELSEFLWRDTLIGFPHADWASFVGIEWASTTEVPEDMREMIVLAWHRHNVIFHMQRKNWVKMERRANKAASAVDYSLAFYLQLKGRAGSTQMTQRGHRKLFAEKRKEAFQKRTDYVPPVAEMLAALNPRLIKLFYKEVERRTGEHPLVQASCSEQIEKLKQDCKAGREAAQEAQRVIAKQDSISRAEDAKLQNLLLLKTRIALRRNLRSRQRAASIPEVPSDTGDSLNEDEDEERSNAFNRLTAQQWPITGVEEQEDPPEAGEAPSLETLVEPREVPDTPPEEEPLDPRSDEVEAMEVEVEVEGSEEEISADDKDSDVDASEEDEEGAEDRQGEAEEEDEISDNEISEDEVEVLAEEATDEEAKGSAEVPETEEAPEVMETLEFQETGEAPETEDPETSLDARDPTSNSTPAVQDVTGDMDSGWVEEEQATQGSVSLAVDPEKGDSRFNRLLAGQMRSKRPRGDSGPRMRRREMVQHELFTMEVELEEGNDVETEYERTLRYEREEQIVKQRELRTARIRRNQMKTTPQERSTQLMGFLARRKAKKMNEHSQQEQKKQQEIEKKVEEMRQRDEIKLKHRKEEEAEKQRKEFEQKLEKNRQEQEAKLRVEKNKQAKKLELKFKEAQRKQVLKAQESKRAHEHRLKNEEAEQLMINKAVQNRLKQELVRMDNKAAEKKTGRQVRTLKKGAGMMRGRVAVTASEDAKLLKQELAKASRKHELVQATAAANSRQQAPALGLAERDTAAPQNQTGQVGYFLPGDFLTPCPLSFLALELRSEVARAPIWLPWGQGKDRENEYCLQ